MNILITAGGTEERIDNVRKITNSSTGKLGAAIAEAYGRQVKDANIFYVCHTNAVLPDLTDTVRVIKTTDVQSVKNAVEDVLTNNKIDIIVHSMAISDYHVAGVYSADGEGASMRLTENLSGKSKVGSNYETLALILKQTPKIISGLRELAPDAVIVGFKLLDGVEPSELLEVGGALMEKNKLDFVLANDLASIRSGKHTGYLLGQGGVTTVYANKKEIADGIVVATTNRVMLKEAAV